MVRSDHGIGSYAILACVNMNFARWTVRLCWLLVVATTLFALAVGPTLDDYMQPVILSQRGPWALYDFLGPSEVEAHRVAGHLPWWTSPELSMRFFRPLSSLDLALDHWVLDGGGLLSHLHGLLWYGALLFLVHQLYRALFDRETARLATPLYALASWHAMPLAFVAARHAVVTAVFAVGSFLVLVRSRPGTRSSGLPAAVLFALALLAGEGALLVVPLMIGWTATRLGFRAGMRHVTPIVALAGTYAIGYAIAGLGAQGSSLYLSPLSSAFIAELPARWLTLAGDVWGSFSTDAALLGARPAQVLWGVVSLLLMTAVLRWLRRCGAPHAKLLIGLTCGSLVAMVPACAAMPGGRALVVVGLAGSALFATVLAISSRNASVHRFQAKWLLAWVWVFGIGLHPVIRTALALDLRRLGNGIAAVSETLSRQCSGQVVLAAGVLDLSLHYVDYALVARNWPAPRAVHLLSMAPGRHRLAQTGAGEFELTIDGDFFAWPFSRNHSNTPLQAGQTARLRDLDLELLATAPETRLRLTLPPEVSPCWLTSGQGGLKLLPFDPPSTQWTPVPPG